MYSKFLLLCLLFLNNIFYSHLVLLTHIRVADKVATVENKKFTCPLKVASFLQKENTAEFVEMSDGCYTDASLDLGMILRLGRKENNYAVQMYLDPVAQGRLGFHLSSKLYEREVVRKSLADRISALYPIAKSYKVELKLKEGEVGIDGNLYGESLKPVEDGNYAELNLGMFDYQNNRRTTKIEVQKYYRPYYQQRFDKLQMVHTWNYDLKEGAHKAWRMYNCAPWGYNGPYFDISKVPRITYRDFQPLFGAVVSKKNMTTTKLSLSFSVYVAAISGRIKNQGVCYSFGNEVISGQWVKIERELIIDWTKFPTWFTSPPMVEPFVIQCKSNFLKQGDGNKITVSPLDTSNLMQYLFTFIESTATDEYNYILKKVTEGGMSQCCCVDGSPAVLNIKSDLSAELCYDQSCLWNFDENTNRFLTKRASGKGTSGEKVLVADAGKGIANLMDFESVDKSSDEPCKLNQSFFRATFKDLVKGVGIIIEDAPRKDL